MNSPRPAVFLTLSGAALCFSLPTGGSNPIDRGDDMGKNKRAIDLQQLYSDIEKEAAEHDLCCGVFLRAGDDFRCGSFGDFNVDGDFILDGAGGFLLGLTVLSAISKGRLSAEEHVSKYVQRRDTILPPELTVRRLLERCSGLPDPLRTVMMPRLHHLPEFAAQSGAEMICREHTALLEHRGLSHQLKLLSDEKNVGGQGFAPSLLEEALLAETVERATGEPLAAWQRKNIFEPLGINALEGAFDNDTGCLSYAESTVVEYKAAANTIGVFTLTFEELMRLACAMAAGYPLSTEQWQEVKSSAHLPQELPYGRRQGILQAHSSVCGRHIDIFIDSENDLNILLASRKPLFPRPDGAGGYHRFDTDIIGCINRQRVYPAHTRMERLSGRNIPSALSLSVAPSQRDFVAAPAVIIAEAAAHRRTDMCAQVGGREVFVITDCGITVGLVSILYEPSADRARLDSLIIDRMFQRRGFGRIAVRWAAAHLRREGPAKLVVCVDRRNTAARALYESEGYVLSAVHDSAYIMEIDLARK